MWRIKHLQTGLALPLSLAMPKSNESSKDYSTSPSTPSTIPISNSTNGITEPKLTASFPQAPTRIESREHARLGATPITTSEAAIPDSTATLSPKRQPKTTVLEE
jgi:hypothetical protein